VSDVSAILLTVGESTTAQARASLLAQTLPPVEIHEISNVAPFQVAFNAGVARVETPFFLQVDADMILDPDCLERLRTLMTDRLGVLIGGLRDPLQGTVQGVKLFRTAYCRSVAVPDTITCETDHLKGLSAHDLESRFLGRKTSFGSHRVDLDDANYQFERFRLMGLKITRRPMWWNVGFRMTNLALSRQHPIAPTAAAALLFGLFDTDPEPGAFCQPYGQSQAYETWKQAHAGCQKAAPYIPMPESDTSAFFEGRRMALLHQNTRGPSPSQVVRAALNPGEVCRWLFLMGYCATLLGVPESAKPHPDLIASLNEHWSDALPCRSWA
jgi:hypothetical protein